MLVGETVVLGRLLVCLLLEGVKVTALGVRGLELGLELANTLAELLGLAGCRGALGSLGGEGVELLLSVDEVEEDVEDARDAEREEERRAGQVDCGLVREGTWRMRGRDAEVQRSVEEKRPNEKRVVNGGRIRNGHITPQ